MTGPFLSLRFAYRSLRHLRCAGAEDFFAVVSLLIFRQADEFRPRDNEEAERDRRERRERSPQHHRRLQAPQPRDYVINVPKKVRRLAMKSALTSKLNEGAIVVVDEIKLADAKTKLMAQVIKALGAEDQKALLVLEGRDETVIRAGKNIPTLKDAYVNTINVYDLLNADKIIVLKGAMQDIQEVYA